MSLRKIFKFFLLRRFYIFFYPIEIVNRELFYKKKLSNIDLNEDSIHFFGHPWILSLMSRFVRNVNWIGQNIFETNRLDKKSTAEIIRKNQGMIFFIDEEGGVYPKDKAYQYFNQRLSMQKFYDQDIVFAWGHIQKELYKEHGIKAFNYGHPRFEPLIPEINSANHENDILIISSCSILTSSKNYSKELGNERFLSEIENHAGKFTKILNLVKKNHSKKIKIRPHPSEDIYLLRKFFRHFDNVFVSNEENILNDIRNSAKVFHFNCTTSVDASTIGSRLINLSEKKYTIIEDLDKGELHNSKWITYPPKMEAILDVIKKNSKIGYHVPIYSICMGFISYFLFSLQLLRPIYRYSLKKSGKFKISKGNLGFAMFNFSLVLKNKSKS